MPKQVIRTDGFHTVIGWDKGHGLVQVGVVIPPTVVERDGTTQMEQTRLVDFVRDFERNDASTGLFATFGSWVDLNEAIRALQTARDGAFGRPA